MKFLAYLRFKIILGIAVIVAIVMIASAYMELRQSKSEIVGLMNEYSSSLLETIQIAGKASMESGYEIEGLLIDRLFDNARLIATLDSFGSLDQKLLDSIAAGNNLFVISVFDRDGFPVLRTGSKANTDDYDREALRDVLDGTISESFIELQHFEESESHFAAAVTRSKKRGAILVELYAENLLEFRKRVGIGKTIRDISNNPGVEYIALQDTFGILAASASIDSLSSFDEDLFLLESIEEDSTHSREVEWKGQNVFEVVTPFYANEQFIGIFRLGLSLDEIHSVESRMIRRIIILSLVLAVITIILLSVFFTSENLRTVSHEFRTFKSFTSSALENMNDTVVVIDTQQRILLFNTSAEELTGFRRDDVLQKTLSDVFAGTIYAPLFSDIGNTGSTTVRISNDSVLRTYKRTVTANHTPAKEIESFTVLIIDLTEAIRIEEMMKRNEKLTATAELASGVAHEIRNPINAIGMMAQRLQREFEPASGKEEYLDMLRVIREEVARVNRIVKQFLDYARPLPMNKVKQDLIPLLRDIHSIYSARAESEQITISLTSPDTCEFTFDAELIKQALANIVLNGIDAVIAKRNYLQSAQLEREDAHGVGHIDILCARRPDVCAIRITDNGIGMEPEAVSKVFDLYYTTKPEGNGIGLSVTQKIISQHDGSLSVESEYLTSTTFTILLAYE